MERPRTEHELNRQLADTIGAAVEQLMGQQGWVEANNSLIDPRNLGQPGSGGADQSTQVVPQPNGQPVAATTTPATPASPATLPLDFEQYKDPKTGLYAGKYPSVEQFAKGLGHAMDMTYRVQSQNDQLTQQLAALNAQLEQVRRQPVITQVTAPQITSEDAPTRGDAPRVGARVAEVLATLSDGNLDAEGLTRLATAISEQAREDALKSVREETRQREEAAKTNADRWDRVDAYMSEKHPASMQFTQELGLFIKTDPEVSGVVTALIEKNLHEQAMVYAWNGFVNKHGLDLSKATPFVPAPSTPENVRKEIVLDAADQVRREAIEEARRHAGVIPAMGAGAHGVHETPPAGPSAGEMDEATALMRQGHGERWRSLVFKDILNHPLFN